MSYQNKSRLLMFGVIGVFAAIAVGLLAGKYLATESSQSTAMREAGIIVLPQSRELPTLQLNSTEGTVQSTQALTGTWRLVFFGYTFCPDICPTTLAELRQLKKLLPLEAKQNMQIIMVSVDPNRDTTEQLKLYLEYFDPEFIGLTGPLVDIQTLSNALSIPFIPGDTSQPRYTVDHSGNLAIIGPDGRQYGFLRAPLDIKKLAEQLPKIITP
ncbi:MAG: SCO family protein [Pseudomonas sp.]|jgi:protein SCO1/2|nr:SCO family protein [Pseudomonas sp.]